MRAEVSTLFGLNVYTDKGVYVGKVNDVVLDPNESRISGLAVGKINPEQLNVIDNKGVILPYRWIIAVGDIVIIKHFNKLKKKEGESKKESD